jgi:hypothetical protein
LAEQTQFGFWQNERKSNLAEQSQPGFGRAKPTAKVQIGFVFTNPIGGFVPPKLRRRTVRRRFGVSGSD